ncbi:ATP-binding protein [uncultured Vibrio sp.]|uniref:ATP-binding protein n=1 Tax=uncultured Vibrio sp. TaxID=114054 RepID=UPI0025F9984F|nr:ATP-binding protein [uncultured Vibrio sp.]
MFLRNLLIQLVLIVSLSAFVSFLFLLPALNSFWRSHSGSAEKIEVYRSAGVVHLLKGYLTSADQDNYTEALAALKNQFHYSIALKDKSQLPLKYQKSERLAQGETLFDISSSRLYHQIDDAGTVLVIEDIDNAAPIHQTPQKDEISAVFHLIIQDLLSIQPTDWPARVSEINGYFTVAIKMMALNDERFSERQREELRRQTLVFEYVDPTDQNDIPEYLFQKMPNKDNVIVIGPLNSLIEEVVEEPLLWRFVAIFGLSIFLPLIIWLHPSWRTSFSLLKATKNFGDGNLSSRADIVKGSNLNGLATTFNKMAEKVETLYENNILLNSAVSHELRTPLTRIEFAIELLRAPLAKHQEKQIHRIENAISDLRIMSDEMALYARFDQVQPDFTLVCTELTSWFDRISEEWADDTSEAAISVDHLSGEIHLPIESFYFRRMIDNVVRNANKYAKKHIHVTTQTHHGECLITIENDGASIDDEYKEKVFDPFFRLDDSRSRNSGGTGLGLAIVKQIVIWHHGNVWIDDGPSGGVSVKIRLPIKV